jgi:hypothetical protein
MIIYKLISGQASDVRFAPDTYIPGQNEVSFSGDLTRLPDIETLHTEPYLSARAAAIASKQAQAQDDASAKAEAVADATLQYLLTHTSAEITTFLSTRLPSLTPAERAIITRMAITIGVLARGALR